MRNGDAPVIIQGAHKRLATPDYVTLNKVELVKKLGELWRFAKFSKVSSPLKFYCTVYYILPFDDLASVL